MCALAAASATGLLGFSRAFAQALADGLGAITGPVIRRTDAAYRAWWASMTWYIFKPERYPDLIVQARSEADVIAAIDHARNHGLKVAVRSTGHNPARSVLRDGGMLLDLSQLREVEIDTGTRTAWVQPGVRAQDLLALTTEHGLAFPAAHTGIVGLGGYLLGGGLGWNMPEYGIACRSVLAAEVITADARKVVASAESEPDLLWAIRGVGPGFFGAVVRYRLQLYPAHGAIRLNSYVIPASQLTATLEEVASVAETAEERLEILLKIGRFHPRDKPYAERDVVCEAQFFAFADSAEEAGRLLAPVAASRLPDLGIARTEGVPLDYHGLYIPPDTDHTSPGRTTVENMWTGEPTLAMGLLADKLIADPPRSPRSFLLSAWSLNSTLEDPTSCVRTAARHYMSWYMIADRAEDIEPNARWMDEAVALMEPFARGHYINEIDSTRYPQRVEACFRAEDWERLRKMRSRYDPQGVFHTYIGRSGADGAG